MVPCKYLKMCLTEWKRVVQRSCINWEIILHSVIILVSPGQVLVMLPLTLITHNLLVIFSILWDIGSSLLFYRCQICASTVHTAIQCRNYFNHSFVANDLPKSFATMLVGETNYAT